MVSVLAVRAPAMCLPILTVHAEISVAPQDERFVKLGSEKRGGGQWTAFPVWKKVVFFKKKIRDDELFLGRFTESLLNTRGSLVTL